MRINTGLSNKLLMEYYKPKYKNSLTRYMDKYTNILVVKYRVIKPVTGKIIGDYYTDFFPICNSMNKKHLNVLDYWNHLGVIKNSRTNNKTLIVIEYDNLKERKTFALRDSKFFKKDKKVNK